MRYFLIFVLSSAALFCFFYFYPAAIFQASIQGGLAEIITDVSLKTLLFKDDFPDGIIAENVVSLKPTLQGILLLLVCLVGLPAMIALRFGKKQA
ncbi:MAG: hypothetical protein IPO32_19010 [Crocinitomicaceae bacterium]|nr:hypothetical protein [Crocinitomicaceae bacterium]MBK9593494.1 hypothetical protein [Crocinitomicaceae bacterium]